MQWVALVGVIAMLLVACQEANPTPVAQEPPEKPAEDCTTDEDCAADEQCIDGACATVVEVAFDEKKSCERDADCICGGKDTATGECFIGNVAYYDSGKVDKEAYCPDFCTGIAGDLRTKCMAGQCAQVSSQEDYPSADDSTGNLRLKVVDWEGSAPFLTTLEAELFGVSDTAEEFSCVPVVWKFGDGREQSEMPDCQPYAKITKQFEMRHMYADAGIYTAQVRIGPAISNTVKIAVRESQGRSPRCAMRKPSKGFCEGRFASAYYYNPDTQTCEPVTGCTLIAPIPFSDKFSCDLACTGADAMGNCFTNEDCTIVGHAGQWCMPATMLEGWILPESSGWRDEYTCYENGGCGCLRNRCTWSSAVEVCLADHRITAK